MQRDSDEAMSVSELTREIRALLENEIGSVWVEGEISNLRIQSSGHQYFTLKDAGAQLSCVMFRGMAQRSAVRLTDGAAVRVYGEVSVYEARGQYQMVVKSVQAQGQGTLQAKFEALKRRLHDEGLFDEEWKKPIPKFPLTVALVTSPTGAAIQDMLNILTRRAPWVRVMVFPVRVQGQGAEREIARAIEILNDATEWGLPKPDTIVVGRGGGSLEDLWNFNEEIVARAIFASEIPVISAVGHEIDFTIADFVADMRAPTPSAAAELLAPDRETLQRHFDGVSRSLTGRMMAALDQSQRVLDLMARGPLMHEPRRRLMEAEQLLDEMEGRLRDGVTASLHESREALAYLAETLARAQPQTRLAEARHQVESTEATLKQLMKHRLQRMNEGIDSRANLLRSLGVDGVLARGFSITMDENGRMLNGPAEVTEGAVIRTRLRDGELVSVVKSAEN
ncbi:MAG: exodeoxyribonuclease VII large subunit [Verrucomicrobiaceae bacterium]|nr:exodeoxyribonuclease VII large subunit [Verrucomicrobiaceae bacterium]